MSTISTTIKINDAFSGALSKLSSGLEKSQTGFDRLKTKLSSGTTSNNGFFKSMLGANVAGNLVTGALGAVGNGLKGLISEMNESSATWQTFEASMRQLGKSTSQINAAKRDMQKFAQQTIYSSADMSSTYQQLAAVGTKNVGQLVKGFGGLAAAADNPKQAMKTLSVQATQMAAKPKVQWQDFKLMLEQTPTGISAVAKAMGKSTQELLKDVQDGKVKTEDFFRAIEKTGNNKYFSNMATQFKTVGQAIDGLTESLGNALLPAFMVISKAGIRAFSSLGDAVNKIDWDKVTVSVMKVIDGLISAVKSAKQPVMDLFSGFKESGAVASIKGMFSQIGNAVKSLGDSFGKIIGKGKNGLFSQLGKISGGAISGVAKAIGSMATALGKIDPSTLQVLGVAFAVLKSGTKGLVLGAVVAGLNALNKLDPGTLNALATAITALAVAFAMWKAATKIAKGISGVADAFGKLKNLKMPKLKTPEIEEPKMQKSSNIAKNAGAYMKLGAALMFVGAGVTLAGVGFKQMADAAKKLASAGGAAIAVFFGMIGAIALLAVLVKTLGAGMIGGAVGFAILGAGLILVGVGLKLITDAATKLASAGSGAIGVLIGIGIAIALLVVLVSVLGPALVIGAVGFFILGAGILLVGLAVAIAAIGLAILATQLPTIAQYGLMAALAIIALAIAIAIFGIGAIVAAIGIIVLAVALVALALGLAIAGIGAIVFAVGLALVAVTAIIAAIGILLLGVGLALVAVFVLIAAVGMIMLGVGIMLVGVFALVAAIGIIMLGVGLMLLMVFALIAAVGMIALGVALMLIMVFALIAAVGIMVLDVAVMVLAVGLALVGAALMLVATAMMMVGVAAMAMVAMFIAAGQMMVSAIRSAMNNVVSAVKNGASRAVNSVKSFVGHMVSAGADLIKGLVNGIKSMVGAAVSAAKSVASKVVGAVKGLLHIGSPSKLMKKFGRWFDQGLIIGINRDSGEAADAALEMAQGMVDAVGSQSAYMDGVTMGPAQLPNIENVEIGVNSNNALASIDGVANALSDLNGSQASVGVNSTGEVPKIGNLMFDMNAGDSLADSFTRALDAIHNVDGALSDLNGSKASVGINLTSLDTHQVGNGSITPQSLVNTTHNQATNNQTAVNIEKGAIQINSSGSEHYDADTLLRKLEQSIMAQRNKSLGGA